mmetsp:Transcript_3846/g.12760  ORF Transcript_3846/g.12760 Transcript_3846/m.12760 type:complete len:219 (-) Transcript_3846:211-867(-)
MVLLLSDVFFVPSEDDCDDGSVSLVTVFSASSPTLPLFKKFNAQLQQNTRTALSLSEKRSQNIFNTCGYSSAMHPNELPLFAMRIVLLLARKTRPSNAHAFNLCATSSDRASSCSSGHKVLKTAASTDANASKIAACFFERLNNAWFFGTKFLIDLTRNFCVGTCKEVEQETTNAELNACADGFCDFFGSTNLESVCSKISGSNGECSNTSSWNKLLL